MFLSIKSQVLGSSVLSLRKMSSCLNKFSHWLSVHSKRLRYRVDRWHADDTELFLEVTDTDPISPLALAAEQKGSLDVEGQTCFAAKVKPEWFHHGTDCEAALSILRDGFKTASELGLDFHWPNGIYSYCDQELSERSMYSQGARVHFQALGIVLPLTAKVHTVPLGGICRAKRSASRRLGADGQEYIHHPLGCLILRMQLNLVNLQLAIDKISADVSHEAIVLLLVFAG